MKNLFFQETRKKGFRIISVLTVLGFLFTNTCNAGLVKPRQTRGTNLAPYLMTKMLEEFEAANEDLAFTDEWFDRYAVDLVNHLVDTSEERNLRFSVTELEDILLRVVDVRAERFELPAGDVSGFKEKLREAFRARDTEEYREDNPKPGTMAGFGVEDLGIDEYGIDLHKTLKEVQKQIAETGTARELHNIIKNRNKDAELQRFLDACLAETGQEGKYTLANFRMLVMKGFVTRFAEIYRSQLQDKGVAEADRERMVKRITSVIISHPGTHDYDPTMPGKKISIYIDDLYFQILDNASAFPDEVDDLFIQLMKHEIWHITHQKDDPDGHEERALAAAPLDKVRRAIKKRTLLVAQSGGDCAGLNTVVGTLAVEGAKENWRVLGVREGFTGIAAVNFEDYLLPIDSAKGERIKYRPSTDLRSSRLNTFEVVDLIKFHNDEGHWSGSMSILSSLKEIADWENRSESDNQKIDELRAFFRNIYNIEGGKDYQDSIDNFVRTLENLEGYGGLIVTGGDDHSRIAMTLSEVTNGRIKCIAVPKSIDADAMVQMTGFRTAAQHLRNRFWSGAITTPEEGKPRVYVAEIMGRKAGWLTLAAATRDTLDFGVPDGYTASEFKRIKDTVMALVPEKPVSIRTIVMRAKEILETKGALNIACSEGFTIDDKNDPLYSDLVKANPLVAEKLKKDVPRDEHGHLKLSGASDFLCAILATDWGALGYKKLAMRNPLTYEEINHAILGYIPRGLTPEKGSWDAVMAERYTKAAIRQISEGKTGLIIGYGDLDDPFDPDNEPGAYPATNILTVGDQRFSRNLETRGERTSSARLRWRRQNTLNNYNSRFRVYTDMMLRHAGILMMETDSELRSYIENFEIEQYDSVWGAVDILSEVRADLGGKNDALMAKAFQLIESVPFKEGSTPESYKLRLLKAERLLTMSKGQERPSSYDLTDQGLDMRENTWSEEEAVYEIRKDFISTAISAWAHKRGNVFEVPDDTGRTTFSVADRYPEDLENWSRTDRASWGKINKAIIMLLPGQEISLTHLAKKASEIYVQYGTFNIVVASGYKLDMEDPVFREILGTDRELREKFLLTNTQSDIAEGKGTFAVDYISQFIAGAVENASEGRFKPGSVRCNVTAKAYNRLPQSMQGSGAIAAVNPEVDLKMRSLIPEKSRNVRKEIEQLSKDITDYMLLQDGEIDNSRTTVFITKSLMDDYMDVHDWKEQLEEQYVILIKQLKRVFGDVVVIDGEGDIDYVKAVLAKDSRAVILDNNSLSAEFLDKVAEEDKAEYGKTFAMISAKPADYAAPGEIPFLNLHAMALLGASLMYDYDDGAMIFESAHKIFTGVSPPKGLFKSIKERVQSGEKYILTVIPRMVKLTTGIVDTKELRKLFSVAA